ncbi:hypothetical protein AB833_02950 [Chromatiales bacterium (ex Bugula neritina AB1)]|nr:hypothetical protein AB833_02950 [Chromatiales bacterium (ex Bugula neritina AB1)]
MKNFPACHTALSNVNHLFIVLAGTPQTTGRNLFRRSLYLLISTSLFACATKNTPPEAVPTSVPPKVTSTKIEKPQASTRDSPVTTAQDYNQTPPADSTADNIRQPAKPIDPISAIIARAEQGHIDSQLQLGHAFAKGDRVERDAEAAKLWFELAAEQGSNKAQFALGNLYFTGNGVKRDYSNAREWWLESAVNGNPDAQQKLGYLYSEGLGVKQDFRKAKNWYIKAAGLGHAEAQTLLGSLHHEGNRLPTNYPEAIKWYSMAAQQGHAHAQYTLATLYHDGLGTATDYLQCAAWAETAIANGYTDNLGARDLCRAQLDEKAQLKATELSIRWRQEQTL